MSCLFVLASQREIGGLVGLLLGRRGARRGLLRVRDLVHEPLGLGKRALEVGAELRRVAENVNAAGGDMYVEYREDRMRAHRGNTFFKSAHTYRVSE